MGDSAPKILSPTETLIDSMEHMDGVTHALVVVANEDETVEIRTGYMPDWMAEGLLRAASKAFCTQYVRDLEDDD